jgi:hypothetical protein
MTPEQMASILRITISDGTQSIEIDPNTATVLGLECRIPLGDPAAGSSILSGQPAYRYITDQVDVLLAPEELLRLLRRELAPTEALALRARYDAVDVFEWHDDFYDRSGNALQATSDIRTDPLWETAYQEAIALLDMHEDLEPTSALRQAGSGAGIPWGLKMGVFVAWGRKRIEG